MVLKDELNTFSGLISQSYEQANIEEEINMININGELLIKILENTSQSLNIIDSILERRIEDELLRSELKYIFTENMGENFFKLIKVLNNITSCYFHKKDIAMGTDSYPLDHNESSLIRIKNLTLNVLNKIDNDIYS